MRVLSFSQKTKMRKGTVRRSRTSLPLLGKACLVVETIVCEDKQAFQRVWFAGTYRMAG